MQSRKTATYGKPSRKPISEFSAFSTASEPTDRYVSQSNEKLRRATTAKSCEHPVQRSDSPEKLATAKRVRSPKAISSPLARSDNAPNGVANHAALVMKEEQEGQVSRLRKKRKLRLVDEGSSRCRQPEKVNLQQDHAADLDREGKVTASIEYTVPRNPTTSSAKTRVISDVSRSKSSSLVAVTPLTLKTQRSPGSAVALDAGKSGMTTSVEQFSSPQIQETQRPLLRESQIEVPKSRETFVTPRRLGLTPPQCETLPPQPTSSHSHGKPSEIEYGPMRSTPQKEPNTACGTPTPKQRKLWEKLLPDSTNSTGLQHLDLYLSSNREGEGQARNRIKISSRPKTDGWGAETNQGTRSAKIIDLLMDPSNENSVSDLEFKEGEISIRENQPSSDSSIEDDSSMVQNDSNTNLQSKRLQYHDKLEASILQTMPSLKGLPKVTYIRERTHLGDNDLYDDAMLDLSYTNDTGRIINPQSKIPDDSRRESDLMEDVSKGFDRTEDSQDGPMRSIRELREAGGNSRINGELGGILDDLEEDVDSSIATRRSSLISLACKLLEVSTCRMFTDQGLETRLLAQLNNSHDVIERSLLVASLLQIFSSTPSAVFFPQIICSKTINFLVGLLDRKEDLPRQVKLRETNMSRLAQTEFTTFCTAFLRSPAWRGLKPPLLSGQILGLRCLELLVCQAGKTEYWSSKLSSDALCRIAETSISLTGTLQSQSPYSRMCLEFAVSILETSTRCGAAATTDVGWTGNALECIASVLPLLSEDSDYGHRSLQSLTLRLYLNLTNVSPQMCEAFSSFQVVNALCRTMFRQFDLLSQSEYQCQDLHVVEKLVLSLGCLINLAESSESLRQTLTLLKIGEQNLLEALLQLFSGRKKAAEAFSEAEAERNVAFGYLSVLLSFLCLNSNVRSYINSRREGPTLDVLLDAVEEFLQYHKQIDDHSQHEETGTDRKASFVIRLQVLVDELKLAL